LLKRISIFIGSCLAYKLEIIIENNKDKD